MAQPQVHSLQQQSQLDSHLRTEAHSHLQQSQFDNKYIQADKCRYFTNTFSGKVRFYKLECTHALCIRISLSISQFVPPSLANYNITLVFHGVRIKEKDSNSTKSLENNKKHLKLVTNKLTMWLVPDWCGGLEEDLVHFTREDRCFINGPELYFSKNKNKIQEVK